MSTSAIHPGVRKRPALFRALGRREPPLEITIQGQPYRRVEVLKHDSWAATAIYQGATEKVVCKFNRVEPIFGVPMDWLGRWLADRERNALKRLSDLPAIPPVRGPVCVGGVPMSNAASHVYIEGHPLAKHEVVSAEFFPTLRRTLDEMHRRGIAYVDLHKRENIIVGETGLPYLIDFQIHVQAGIGDPVSRKLFDLLCRSDDYHLHKHILHHQGRSMRTAGRAIPWWLRLHRKVAVPFRECRRKMLAWIRIRKQEGRAESEHFAEDAVRRGKAA